MDIFRFFRETCPVCGEGKLHKLWDMNFIHAEIRNPDSELLAVRCEFSACDVCHSDVSSPKQINRNHRHAKEAREEWKRTHS